MTERDDSARRAGESAGLSVSGVETDTQTEGAEVEALRVLLTEHDESWHPTPHSVGAHNARAALLAKLAAREAAAEVRGAQAVLAAVEAVHPESAGWCNRCAMPHPCTSVLAARDAARAAAAVTTSSAKSSDLATRVPQDESQRAAGGGAR